MRVYLCILFAAACSLADDSESRRSKLPYVADAVGNTLPPPSNLPATVGSPVNLITPDRYEFYTFDESGELVKRLMTLEEIQAIVAAGEETEGLVTFANENQPTIAFNFSQPPYTKVHNVVTNVQNVLKAQMEAHKNKPHTQPTLDTPDVSDSWSLILPSIFGNTGVDIVPDKTSGAFTTPETEMIELDRPADENSLSKEGSSQIFTSSSTASDQELKEISVTEKLPLTTVKIKRDPSSTTTPKSTPKTTTTTAKPTTTVMSTTTTTTSKPTTTTTTTTTSKPTTTTSKPTTSKPTTTTISTTSKPSTTSSTTTSRTTTTSTTTTTRSQPRVTSTTSKPSTTTTAKPTTTVKPIVRTTPKITTAQPTLTTRKQVTTTQKDYEGNFTRIQVQTVANTPTTEKSTLKYEKLSTFIPISTAAYVTERTTQKTLQTTKPTTKFASTTKRFITTTPKAETTTTNVPPTTYRPLTSTTVYVSSTLKEKASEKLKSTTLTTQSVSPSTTMPSTEYISVGHSNLVANKPTVNAESDTDMKDNDEIPLFDVAQSISQIASDLGNYRPIPTTSDLLDTTRINELNAESKESLEIDIPSEAEKESNIKISNNGVKSDNFVKISTLDPHEENDNKIPELKETVSKSEEELTTEISKNIELTTNMPITTTIDPVLSESMEDLLSQVVNQGPQTIVSTENTPSNEIPVVTTEKSFESTTTENSLKIESTSDYSTKTELETTTKLTTLISESKNISSDISKGNLTISNDIKELNFTNTKSENIAQENVNLNKNGQNNQNFVQISISSTETGSTVKTIIAASTQTPNVNSDKIKDEDKVSQMTNTKKETNVASPLNQEENENKEKNPDTPTSEIPDTKVETSPLKKIDSISTQSNVSKISSLENNKLTSAKDKNSEIFPKVDEFKKKIQKVNIDEKELENERNNSWKLISTVTPPKANEIQKDKLKTDGQEYYNKDIVLDVSKENQGLEITTKDLGEDVAQFTELCNELAFRYWHTMIENIDKKRSFVLSPYSITSMLAMMFMGARGATSGEMNEILKLDDMVTFNPHFTLKNISDSLEMTPVSGVVISAFVRELFSDRSKGKILTFYKERAQHFYNGHVEEINFKLISDIIRRRTNLLVKRYTYGKILEYMKSNTITMQPPLAAFSVNIFQTDCSDSSVDGRDGEMYFVVSPNVRQRRLVPVPAVVYKSGFLAGYDPVLDATAAALGNTIVSTLFLMPGQQGNIVHAEDLEALENRLLESSPTTHAWKRLLRTLLPRMGLELQIPRFSHKSLFNVSSTLKQMGLKDIFDAEHADLGGLIGPSKDLYLSDMIQSTTFVTCGGGVIGEQHHIEEYPESLEGPQRRRTSRWATGWDEPRDYQRAFHDPHDVGEAMHLPLHLRPRQARLPARNAQPARLKFDRPFLYFVRHNPTGMILYVGRYNPRLLP